MSSTNLHLCLDFIKSKSIEQLVELGFQIKTEKNLLMVSYTDAVNLKNPVFRQMNGIIVDKDTCELVHHSFPKTYEGFINLEDRYTGSLDKYSIEFFTEGSLIRLFYNEGEWQIGTARNINAALAHWGCDKSFKELFLEIWDPKDFQTLDPAYCYSYILQHPDIKIGLDINIPCILPINKINRSTLEKTSFTKSSTLDLTIEAILSNPDRHISDNFIIVIDDDTKVKLLAPEYEYAKNLLNNNPSIIWAYLECLKENREMDIRHYYHSQIKVFDKVEEKIKDFVNLVHEEYLRYYVVHDKNYKFTKKIQRTVTQLHARFLKTKQKTTKAVIKSHLMDMKTSLLFWLLDPLKPF